MSRFLSNINWFLLFCCVFLTACGPSQAAPKAAIPAAPTPLESTQAPALTPRFSPTRETPTAAISSICSAKAGSLDKGVINTDLLDKPMRYSVYLPPCYASNPQTRYPVLYLLHGQGFTEEQWIRIGATSAADSLISSGAVTPFIMVFPYDYSYKQPTEYKFEEVFIRLLLQAIDGTYRTMPSASQRAVGGLSRGGAWALRLGIRNPDLFGAVGGHSPAIFFADNKSLLRKLQEIPLTEMPRLWLDIGESDSDYTVILSFEEFLDKNKIPHEWHTFVGWHDEKYWSAHVNQYLSWYAQGWR